MKNTIFILATLLSTAAIAQSNLTVTSTSGNYDSECSWTLIDENESFALVQGDVSSQIVSLQTAVYGTYTLTQIDSWGDGWNGASLTITCDSNALVFDQFTAGDQLVTLFDHTPEGLFLTPNCQDESACNYGVLEFCEYPESVFVDCDGVVIDAIVIDCDDEFGWVEVLEITYETVDSLGNVTFGAGNQEFILSADGTTVDAALAGDFLFDGAGFVGECGNGYEGCTLFISGYDGELNVFLTPAEQELQDTIDDLQAQVDSLLGEVDSLTDSVDSLTGELEDCSTNLALAAEQYYGYGYDAGYADGLEDCEGEPSGLIDIDGNTVIPVVGYYNELGQVIDPRRHNGLIIRRHADGTFSKYVKSLR